MTRLAPRATAPATTRPAGAALAVLLLAWAGAASAAGAALAIAAPPASPAGWALLPLVAAVVGLALLVGLRQLVLVVAALLPTRRAAAPPLPDPAPDARVAILYPVADDFRADVVRRSARQTHPGTRVVVLDDSRDPAVGERIAALGASGVVEVHRRADRSGAKAGNLNRWLERHGHEVDHVVVLDADQEAEPGFVAGALARAAAHPEAAVVQGTILARASATAFSRDFAGLFERHAAVQLAGRARLGIGAFCGRGALLDVAAVRAAGGVPELVMEDTALTVELARQGRAVVAAPELVTVEDAPIDHAAFAVQFGKFTEGAAQLLVRSRRAVVDRRLPVRRRIDLQLELLVPIAAALVPVALCAWALLAAATGAPAFPWQLGLPLAALGVVPLLPETAHRIRSRGPVRGLAFGLRASMLYASVALVAARGLAAVAVSRRARFRITPKVRVGGDAAALLRRRALELAAAAAAIALAVLWAGRPEAAMPVVAVAVAAMAFGLRDALDARGPAPQRLRATTAVGARERA